jgi:hypothetical protein
MKRAIALIVLALSACEQPAAPGRGNIYSYADTLGGAPQIFHWPETTLPVRYYAAAEGALPEISQRGLEMWQDQFLYGEFRATLWSDSNTADVILRFSGGPPPPADPDTSMIVAACQGVTTPLIDPNTSTLERPMRVTLSWFTGNAPEAIAACLERVVAHELGHTLGLFNAAHAGTNATDLMAGPPRVYAPSDRDRSTVEVLYHTPPTIRPPR